MCVFLLCFWFIIDSGILVWGVTFHTKSEKFSCHFWSALLNYAPEDPSSCKMISNRMHLNRLIKLSAQNCFLSGSDYIVSVLWMRECLIGDKNSPKFCMIFYVLILVFNSPIVYDHYQKNKQETQHVFIARSINIRVWTCYFLFTTFPCSALENSE